MLNYFTTLGTTLADVCTSYKDREGDPVTVNRCDTLPNGPRGAWDEEDFARQQAKIVKAINAIDADVTAIVDEVNAAADRLTADGADAVVLLAHEGAQDVTPEAAQNVAKAFGKIVAGVDDDVDAIFSAHTHLRYAHEIDGRPVISAGEYGTHVAKVVLSVDPATDEVSVTTNEVVEVAKVPAVAPEAVALKDEVASIVAEATSQADVLGARELGQVDSPLRRAVLATGAENRGGESTLGNLVAEVHRWATRKDAQGGAEIAFMNPGGLRADMVGNAEGGYPAAVTYKQAAAVQPFANTLVNMKLTGAQLKEVLEQQWQLDASGNVPTRPFLRLGASDGFTYTFDETRAQGDRITGIWLDGRAIQTSRNYSVTVNSFLASGGDNFRAFASGAERVDTGQSDLTAMVDYMAANTPVAVDTAQRAVGLVAPAEAFHLPGSEVTLKVSSWSYSAPGSVVDEEIAVLVDGKEVGTAAVDNTVAAEPFDLTGRSDVTFTLPADLAAGTHTVTLKGRTTGTEVDTPLVVKAASALEVVSGAPVVKVGENAEIKVKVAGTDSGLVSASVDGRVVGGTDLVDGAGTLVLAPFTSAGARTVELKFHGTATAAPATATTTVTVEAAPVEEKATPTLTVSAAPRKVTVNTGRTTLDVRVAGGKGTPTGTLIVLDGSRLVGAGDLVAGRARITVENLKSVGRRTLTVRYLGDDARRPALATIAVDVVKASPKVTISTPKRVTVGSRATVKVKVKATGQKVSGKVRISVTLKGRITTRTVTVKGGVASAKFSLKRVGRAKVKATYLGNSTVSKKSAKSSRITVVAKRR